MGIAVFVIVNTIFMVIGDFDLRLLLASSIATCVFLFLTFVSACYQTGMNVFKYGWSYSETVTINGESTTTVVGWQSSIFSVLLLLWLCILTLLLSGDIILAGRTKGGLNE